MKKSLILIAGVVALALNAADINWLVKIDKSVAAKDAQKASTDGIMPADCKKITTKGSKPVSFNRFTGRMYYNGTGLNAVVYAKLTFDQDCKQMVGFGVNN